MLKVRPLDRLHVYVVCWNEEKILPYFLRHYAQFADWIFVYDNESTDGTHEIVKSHPKAVLRHFPRRLDLSSLEAQTNVKNKEWKRSRGVARWVVVCDMDELLYHPNLLECLASFEKKGVTVPRPKGYDMYHSHFPATTGQIYQEVTKGVYAPKWFNKRIVFDPNAIEHMGYEWGCHKAHPKGKVVYGDAPNLYLLHFKNMGLEWSTSRNAEMASRFTPVDHNIRKGQIPNFCGHHLLPEDERKHAFDKNMKRAEILPVFQRPIFA